MKRKSLFIFILLIILVATGFVLFKSYNDNKNEVAKDEPIKDETTRDETNKDEPSDEMNSYEFKTQLGEDVIIKADKLVTATGFAGATNHHFYLKNNDLYYRNTSSLNEAEILIAKNIDDVYLEQDQVIATLKRDSKIMSLNSYLKYKNSFEGKNTYEFKTQFGENVVIKADKLVTATGFTGSSFYHFYLLGNTLYLKNTSNLENEEQIIAYNIKNIGEEKYDIYAIEDDNTIIVNQTNYITFKKEN